MRQRKLKNLDERLDAFSRFIIEEPAAHRGRWKEVFGNDKPIWLEIGCGKGQFITRHAALHPERNYIAVEGHESVVLRALEKAAVMNGTAGTAVDTDGAPEVSGAGTADDAANSAGTPGGAGAEDTAGPGNLCFILEYVRDIRDLFADGELEGIYLNFSDPWPKERHAKRRLTYGKRLRQYAQIIRPGGVIAFKTDNEGAVRLFSGADSAGGHGNPGNEPRSAPGRRTAKKILPPNTKINSRPRGRISTM